MQKPTYNDLNTWLEHAIQERDHLSVKVETLQDDLEKTRKALDVAVDAMKRLEKELYFNNAKQTGHIADSVMSILSIALEQITTITKGE